MLANRLHQGYLRKPCDDSNNLCLALVASKKRHHHQCTRGETVRISVTTEFVYVIIVNYVYKCLPHDILITLLCMLSVCVGAQLDLVNTLTIRGKLLYKSLGTRVFISTYSIK